MSEENTEDIPNMRRVNTNRAELAMFLPTPRLIKTFEDLTANVQQALPAAIGAVEEVAQNALFGASLASGTGASARSAADKLVPAVQALETEGATDRSLSGEVGRVGRRVEQVESLLLAPNRNSGEMSRLRYRIEQLEAMVLTLARVNSEIPRLQSRIAQLEALVLGA